MIVFRTPKGWTGPREVDGVQVEGTWRAHQVPLAEVRRNDAHRALLEDWMRSYRPEELFDAEGTLVPELAALPPEGERRMSGNPKTNGGLLLRDLSLPDFRRYAVEVERPGIGHGGGDAGARLLARRRRPREPGDVPHLRPGRDGVEPARRDDRGEREAVGGDDPAGRRAPRAGRARRRDALGAPVPGLARGLPPHRPARPVQLLRGVHPHRRLDVQPAREVAEGDARHPVAAADRLAQLPAELARLAPGPQRLLAPGSRLHRPRRRTRRRRSSASTCRRTRTACSRWPTTACAAATT